MILDGPSCRIGLRVGFGLRVGCAVGPPTGCHPMYHCESAPQGCVVAALEHVSIRNCTAQPCITHVADSGWLGVCWVLKCHSAFLCTDCMVQHHVGSKFNGSRSARSAWFALCPVNHYVCIVSGVRHTCAWYVPVCSSVACVTGCVEQPVRDLPTIGSTQPR